MDNSPVETAETDDTGLLELTEPVTIVSESTEKRKRGRPRLDSMPSGTVAPARDPLIPSPLYRTYRSDSRNPNQLSKIAWNYWNNLPPWAKGRIDAYIYRDHPPLLEPPLKDDGSGPQYYKYIDKIPGDTPIQDDIDLLNRYGAGSYHVMLSETASTKKEDKAICTIWIQNVGGADYRSNPPTDDRIRDVSQVDLDNPACKSYKAYLIGEKKLPGQFDTEREEGDMAQVQIIEKLTDKMVQMAENTSTGKNKDAGVLQDAMKGAMDVMQKGAEAAIKTTQEANEYAAKVRQEADVNRPAATATSDPMMLALKIVELIHSERPAPTPGTDARYDALQAQLSQLQQSQIDRLSKQVETLLDAKVTGPAASTSPFSAMDQGLDSLEKFNNVMTRLRGDKEEGEGTAMDAVADAAPKWMRPILPLIPGLAQGVISWLQMRQAQPQPTYVQMADGRIMPIAVPQVIPPQQQIQAGPGYMPNPIRSPYGPQPVPSPTTNPAQSPDPIYTLLSSIAMPLLNNLQVNGTGTDFADWFIGGYGQQMYEDVMQLGPDTLFQAINTFPPIATHPIYVQVPVEQVQAFVTEFCDPKWPEEGDEEEGATAGAGTGTGTGSGPGPVPA